MNYSRMMFKVLEITFTSNDFYFVNIISKNFILVEPFKVLLVYRLCASK